MIILMLLYMIVGFGIIIFGSVLSDVPIMLVGTFDLLIASLINDWGIK